MKKVYIISLILIVLLVLVIRFFPYEITLREKANPNEVPKLTFEKNTEIPKFDNNQEIPIIDDEVSGTLSGGESGGTSGGGNSKSSGLSKTCTEELVSYSLRNFVETSTCNSFSKDICVSKTATCSVLLTNFDENFSGTFIFEFIFFESGNPSNIIQSSLISSSLNPGEFENMHSEITITGENANLDISCSINPQSIPTKQVCI